ncbi:unnamed protein product [Phytophthora fragariaefolia]|uniref:Unnamed protein product n=1 Tax=Phytophthora fragariaefolia TaxID=1490495 RepID=A0A9W7D6R8_9STRA|nr:unnamed protein product [Phytophthora fragariaefolia]
MTNPNIKDTTIGSKTNGCYSPNNLHELVYCDLIYTSVITKMAEFEETEAKVAIAEHKNIRIKAVNDGGHGPAPLLPPEAEQSLFERALLGGVQN